MSYENAPATRMLATHCTACGRPLVDADSVTAGMGPECRKYAKSIPADVREQANRLIYACARDNVTADELTACVVELSLLGCHKIAERIAKRAGKIVLTVHEASITVVCPYSDTFLSERGPGRWDHADRLTRYQPCYVREAARAIASAFPRGVVRLDVKGKVRFVAAAELEDIAETLAADAPARPAPVEPEQPAPKATPKWHGQPASLGRGQWGVAITHRATAQTGDTVEIRARNGKTWCAKLSRFVKRTGYGEVWETARL